jgi:adenylate cyclase
LKQYLPRYVLGLLILLVLLGHSARIYQIPFINHMDALIYDMKVRLTMPQSVDQRVVILDIDEKSLAEQGRWPWGRDKLATLMNKLFDQYGVKLVGFDVVFAEPDESSGLKSLESLAKKELKDVVGFQSTLRELRPQLDHDARFAAALKNRPIILGYYFSSKEGGVSSGAAPEPALSAAGA